MRTRQENKQSKKRIFPLPLHVYLCYLIVCTLLLTGISFSRYLTAASGSDSARAAAGVVVVEHDQNTLIEMKRPGGTDSITISEFNFSVSNRNSEVAIRYDVSVTLKDPLPNGITMKLDGKPCSTQSGNTYTFSNMGTFEAGMEQTIPHVLTFIGDFDVMPQMPSDSSFPMTISVCAEQID